MSEFISYQQKIVTSALDYFKKTFSFVPDDKLNFMPSSTAKSPIQIAAHIALTNKGFASMLKGEPSKFSSVKDLLIWLDGEEKKLNTRELVLKELESSEQILFTAIQSLRDENLDDVVKAATGTRTKRDSLVRVSSHIFMHGAQIDYIQSIYGDLDPHF